MTRMHYPEKIKLGGADCFHLVLDRHAAHHESGGNVVRMSFHLKGRIDIGLLKGRLENHSALHWLCNITLKNGNFLSAPYWKYADVGLKIQILEHHSEIDEIPEIILQRDIPLGSSRYAEADIIHAPQGDILVLSWNHILMDGRGAGLLARSISQGEACSLETIFGRPVKSGSLEALRRIFRIKKFIEASSSGTIASVAAGRKHNGSAAFRLLEFDPEETLRLNKNAKESGSRFGNSAFLLAASAMAISGMLAKRGQHGPLWIPVPYDGRKRGAAGPLLSNHVSTIFYRLEREDLNSAQRTVASLSKQLAAQVDCGMPALYNGLQDLMRHFPQQIYYHLVAGPGKGALASFLFSATGEGISNMKDFMGIELRDIIVWPPHTFPPGLTFLFLRFNDRIKLHVSYTSSAIEDEELDELVTNLRSVLLA